MEVAFPDWLHGHEHGSLDDAIRHPVGVACRWFLGYRFASPAGGDNSRPAGFSAGHPDADPV